MEYELNKNSAAANGDAVQASGSALHHQLRIDAAPATKRLSGHVALVTGGGTGLGRAIATHMTVAGARVVILGRTLDCLQETVDQLGPGCSYVVHDLCELDAAGELIKNIVDSIGTPSILVNNAGEHLKQEALETSSSELARIMKTHVDAAFSLSTAAARTMIASGRTDCSILFISSMASLFGIPGVAAYSAAKTAQLGLVRTLATEWSALGIRVNSIAPGWIDTKMSQSAFAQDESRLQRVLQRTPMGRLGTPEEVARVATFLASAEASFVTGTVIPVDGGASIGF